MPSPVLPSFELTGPISHIATPEQVNAKLWKRVVILDVVDEKQPGEGEIKIEFLQHLMELLEGVKVGDMVTIRFTVRGVAYVRAGNQGHMVILRGHYLRVLSESESPSPRPPYTPFGPEPAPENEDEYPSYIPIRLPKSPSKPRQAAPGEEPPF